MFVVDVCFVLQIESNLATIISQCLLSKVFFIQYTPYELEKWFLLFSAQGTSFAFSAIVLKYKKTCTVSSNPQEKCLIFFFALTILGVKKKSRARECRCEYWEQAPRLWRSDIYTTVTMNKQLREAQMSPSQHTWLQTRILYTSNALNPAAAGVDAPSCTRDVTAFCASEGLDEFSTAGSNVWSLLSCFCHPPWGCISWQLASLFVLCDMSAVNSKTLYTRAGQ